MKNYLWLLYFDTNALLKYLLPKEKGHFIIKFLVENQFKYNYSLYTSQIAFYEMKKVLKRKVSWPAGHIDKISRQEYGSLLHRIRRTLIQVFKIIDDKPAHIQKSNYFDLVKNCRLKSWDARHWAVVLNHLSHFKGVAIVNSDRDFNHFISESGFQLIDPENINERELTKILK